VQPARKMTPIKKQLATKAKKALHKSDEVTVASWKHCITGSSTTSEK
jgi:hypothetical protein